MASLDGPVDGDSFPAVNATRELNLGVPEEFPVDPISSDVETSKKLKEAEARERAAAAEDAEKCKCCFSGPLGTTLTVAVVVAAAVGVAFFVTKKLKHA
ncbi:uncharacterized protein LOC109839763 isoform X2 [Asparagus officinalis]|uniref:uncharacterized protein LOC109839763 isoform X2 n=1 Tax=Asparagus officinalis TaxID=4686 RepID=UPI00098E7D07|nr:uncharacterized protein LOC109839763 isoform X2 [Asparagus officinalis]